MKNIKYQKTTIASDKILFNEKLYARFTPSQELIAEYESSIDEIINSGNLAKVSKDLVLIDGYHRWKAFQRKYGSDSDIPVLLYDTRDKVKISLLSFSANTRHGKRNTKDENIRNIRRLYSTGVTLEQIQESLGLGKTFIYEATSIDRQIEKENRDKQIIDTYLKAESKIKDIQDQFGIAETSLRRLLKNRQTTVCENLAVFKPFLYNIWNAQKGDKSNNHFGHFPNVFMENLLYYNTKPTDIVFDPFGSGVTVDVCKKMFRRYYVSDRNVIPGREQDIKTHDIKNGLPDDLPKPDLAFLDLSKSNRHIGIKSLLNSLTKKKAKLIAILAQPTQDKETLKFTDHIFSFAKMLTKYEIKRHYYLPLNIEYDEQMVNKAKEVNIALNNIRDLIVLSLK